MSEEMAVSDNATGEDATVQSDSATVETVAEAAEELTEQPNEVPTELPEEPPVVPEEKPEPVKLEPDPEPEPHETETTNEVQIKDEVDETEVPLLMDIKDEFEATDNMEYPDDDDKRGIKRRASDAFDDDVEFKGFEKIEDFPQLEYSLILQRLEAEVKAASKGFRPLRTVMATPSAPVRATKRPRQDTDGSRSSSALSSRSEDDVNPSASPAQRGRRTTSEMTSPLFRVPIELGWKRELVYRAALDAHSRRNADIYYYTPYGMKLRSMREIGEHLSGTGLTLDNFTFFKEPLGLDDPEKEIIRDAKLVGGYRRVESPASPAAAAADGKRTPKPKQPKGVSPEPATPKSPPAKLKVKSVGSRLSGTPAAPAKKKATPAPASPALPSPAASPAPVTTPAATPATPDNNNTAAWKKPRAPQTAPPAPVSPPPVVPPPVAPPPALVEPPAPPRLMTPPPPPPLLSKPTMSPTTQSPRQLVQPCSMSCGSGVPSLSCSACLCLYHPACAGFKQAPPPKPFLCKNCRKSSSPPRDPPPLTHKSGHVTTSTVPPAPRRMPAPPQLNTHKPNDKRVLLRMKVSSGGADGEKVWAVAAPRAATPRAPPPNVPPPAAPPAQATPPARLLAIRGGLPQSLAVINGRRFIIVPRPAPLPNAAQQVAHAAAK